jgi:hypothetical protein
MPLLSQVIKPLFGLLNQVISFIPFRLFLVKPLFMLVLQELIARLDPLNVVKVLSLYLLLLQPLLFPLEAL